MNHAQRISDLRSDLEHPLLVTSLPNIRYLTGFTGSNAYLLVGHDGEAVFVTDGRYGEVATRLVSTLDDVELVVYSGAVRNVLADVLRPFGRVGLEASHVSWDFVREVRNSGVAELVPTSGLVEGRRMVKDVDEVEALRAAAAAGDAAFSDLESLAATAATERELGWALVDHMRRGGAEQAGWEPIVAVGPHAARPHHRAGTGDVRPGLLLLDYGCVVDGYHSDMTRTVWRGGQVDTEMERVYQAVLEANLAGIAAATPGATGHDVDAACREVLRSYGLEVHFIHSTGHGVGLEIHEDPRAAKESDHVLEPGNVITVEPGVYLEGRGGVRIEDMVLITDDGNEVLTTSPKEWMAA